TVADANGVYRFDVAPGISGFIECRPPGFANLRLTTFISTVGRQPGTSIHEDVTPTTFVIAKIIRDTGATDPLTTKNRFIQQAAAQEQSTEVLVDTTTILFNALLQAKLDTDLAAALDDLLADGQLDTPALQSVAAQVAGEVEAAEQRRKVALIS